MRPITLILSLVAAIAPSPTSREQSLRKFLQLEHRQMRDDLQYRGQDPGIRYQSAFVDLNGDGADETIVYVTGDGLCGSGGCKLHILTPSGTSWREVTVLSITRPPIRALNSRSHGWRDISVFVAGGGILPGYNAKLPFDGRTYPTNPSVPPARQLSPDVQGEVLIDEEDRGQALY